MTLGKEDGKTIGYDPEEIAAIDDVEVTSDPIPEISPGIIPPLPKRLPRKNSRDIQNEVICRVPRPRQPIDIVKFQKKRKSPKPEKTP